MKHKSSAKIVLVAIGCLFTVILTMLAFIPFLDEILEVEVDKQQQPVMTVAPTPGQPETVPVTVYYIMEENSKKISELYVEVFPVGQDTVFYLKIPTDTKVNLSEELYKSLQTYAPELPQHFKISNMAESFSKEYGLTGSNRILSEVLGMSFSEYVRTDAASFCDWLEVQEGEKNFSVYFEGYAEWMENSSSGRKTPERWSYYESRQKICRVVVEEAPGSREKDGYLISAKRTKERLEEMMRYKDTGKLE